MSKRWTRYVERCSKSSAVKGINIRTSLEGREERSSDHELHHVKTSACNPTPYYGEQVFITPYHVV